MYTVCWIEGDSSNRQDKWGRGTYDEISALITELNQRDDVCMEDVLIIPPHNEETNGVDFLDRLNREE